VFVLVTKRLLAAAAWALYAASAGGVVAILRWRTTCNVNTSNACLGVTSAPPWMYVTFLVVASAPAVVATARSTRLAVGGASLLALLTAAFWAILLAA
jgi:hypothetical protein